MKKYEVRLCFSGYSRYTVLAEDEDEAWEKAQTEFEDGYLHVEDWERWEEADEIEEIK